MSMFSQTAEYALRAVTWLAEHQEEGSCGAQRIAENTKVPPSYLAKILQQLAQQGVVHSRRGVGGGFRLAIPPEELSVLTVVNAVDPICRIKSCPLHLDTHQENLCPMHARMDEAMAHVEKVLGDSMLADLLADTSRPTPLCDAPKRA